VNTVLYRSRTGEAVWKEVLADTLDFVSIDKTAKRLRLLKKSFYNLLLPILALIQGFYLARFPT